MFAPPKVCSPSTEGRENVSPSSLASKSRVDGLRCLAGSDIPANKSLSRHCFIAQCMTYTAICFGEICVNRFAENVYCTVGETFYTAVSYYLVWVILVICSSEKLEKLGAIQNLEMTDRHILYTFETKLQFSRTFLTRNSLLHHLLHHTKNM